MARTESIKVHAYLSEAEVKQMGSLIMHIKQEAAPRTVPMGNIHAAILRHGLNNPEKIKKEFL